MRWKIGMLSCAIWSSKLLSEGAAENRILALQFKSKTRGVFSPGGAQDNGSRRNRQRQHHESSNERSQLQQRRRALGRGAAARRAGRRPVLLLGEQHRRVLPALVR